MPAPTAPRFPSVTAPGGPVLDLSWVEPLSAAPALTHYEVAVVQPDDSQGPWESTGGVQLTWRLRGLALGHRYGLRLRAVNPDGSSAPTAPVYGRPATVGAPVQYTGHPIPLINTDRQSLIVRLAGQDCRVTVWWQPSDSSWWGSLEVPVNTPVVRSRRLALNSGLLDRLGGVLPGNLVLRELGGAGLEPGRDAWTRPTHSLVWEPA